MSLFSSFFTNVCCVCCVCCTFYETPTEQQETETVGALKECVRKVTGVTEGLRLMLRGAILKDESRPLGAAGVRAAAKLLLVGSAASEIAGVNDRRGVAPVADAPAPVARGAARGVLPVTLGKGVQDQPVHRRIIDAGPPADALPGVRGARDVLPAQPLTGILNGRREATRLTFKPFAQELWISTHAQTEKVPFFTVRNVMWEPIRGHEEYAVVAFQLGALDSERSRYYVYWVPVQYAQAIRNTIL